MRAYPDSSFLVAAYFYVETHSAQATQWLEKQKDPLLFTPLQRHELRTALRFLEFRGEMTATARQQAYEEIQSDSTGRVLIHTPIPWTDAFREADLVGEAQGSGAGIRSLDLLHIGIAMALKVDLFLTFDEEQLKIARAAGLKVNF